MRALLILPFALLACTSDPFCSPDNCNGCCAGDTCVETPTAQSCGDHGFQCKACGGGESCVQGGCLLTSNPDGGPTMRAFATQQTFSGDLKAAGGGTSGLDGADKLCNQAAAAAGLSGTFKAWLSDSNTDAIDRINDVGPWYSTGTQLFVNFANKAQLAQTPTNPLSDEHGNGIGSGIWTGTATGGHGTGSNCSNWTMPHTAFGTTGDPSSISTWTNNDQIRQCQNPMSIYCFQQ